MKILVILGATASGKTRLAVELARQFNGEILSADSRQVYQGLDIGTGKDLHEYGQIPYHLIDVVKLGNEFNLFEFQQRFYTLVPQIYARNHLPIMAGGTGLYLASIIQAYQLAPAPIKPTLRANLETLSDQELATHLLKLNPKQHNVTNLEDRQRMIRAIEIAQITHNPTTLPDYQFLTLGLRWERAILRQRIATRLNQRLDSGLIEEVETLLKQGANPETLIALGLEYRFITHYIQGKLNRDELFQNLHQGICQFAKRQETWFRRMARQGVNINWLEANNNPFQTAIEIITTNWPEQTS